MTKEELEKEAEEKYSEVDREFIACQDEGEVFNIGYVLGAEPREKRIAELERKLTEKVTLESLDVVSAKINELENNLTKAKELLGKLLKEEENNMYWEMNGSDKSSYYEVRKQAEQFLKE